MTAMPPACTSCKEPTGTCFPAPCKIYVACKKAAAAEDREILRDKHQRRLLAIEMKLASAGLDLDELIELIEARQKGRY